MSVIFICDASYFGCFCVKSFVFLFLSHKIQERFWNSCPIYSLMGYNSPNQYCVGVHLAHSIVIFSANGSHLLSHAKIKKRFILFILAINSACSLCRKKVIKGSIIFFSRRISNKFSVKKWDGKEEAEGLPAWWTTSRNLSQTVFRKSTVSAHSWNQCEKESFLQFSFYTLGTSLWPWHKFIWNSALISIDVISIPTGRQKSSSYAFFSQCSHFLPYFIPNAINTWTLAWQSTEVLHDRGL